MKSLWSFLIAIALFGCTKKETSPGDVTAYIPNSSAVILKMQDPDLFFSNVKNNEFFRNNSENPLLQNLKEQLSLLNLIPHKKPAYLAFSPTKEGSFNFIFITEEPVGEVKDSLQKRQIGDSTPTRIREYESDGKKAFSASRSNFFIFSNSKRLLEESLSGANALTYEIDFQKAMKAASPKKPAVFINHEKFQPFLQKYFSLKMPFLNGFSNWTVLDTEVTQQEISLNGITTATDTVSRLINVFNEAGTAKNQLASITPINSTGFYSVTFKDFPKLRKNLQHFRKNSNPGDLISEENELLENASEIGNIYLEKSSVFAVKVLDAEIARNSFSIDPAATEKYREIDIFGYPGGGKFKEILEPIIALKDLKFLAFLDSFLVFAETSEALKEVISAYKENRVLGESAAYSSISKNLSSEASILLVANNKPFKNVLSEQVSEEIKEATGNFTFEDHPISALQFIYQSDFAHVHAVMSKNTELQSENSTSQKAAVTLEADLATRPYFFKNHRTKRMDIAVQDLNNTLYLISPTGKIYWKKNLNSRIIGKIHTVDILRNGRFQLVFATQDRLHLIDRDGNEVKPFPLEFRDQITQPLAVFDYDNNRDYRFLITQSNEVFMYDRKGKRVNGFSFSNASSEINQTPKHIRIGRKDYIVVPEASGKLNILSRTGKTRVPVSEGLDFSENEWYEHEGNFVSTNTSGELVTITEQGSVTKENLELSVNHKIIATENLLVTFSENELRIGEKTIALDFGLYTDPQIFHLKNTTYVSLTDTQSSRVYLFNSNAELLPGFPIYGNSVADLADADNDEGLELVVQGEGSSVLVYEVE